MVKQNDIKSKISDIRSFLIEWNNRFPFDRIYRKKYNIPFGCEEHLNVSQIDIYLDIAEDRMINNLFVDMANADTGRGVLSRRKRVRRNNF